MLSLMKREVFAGGFEFALRLFHAYLSDKALGSVDHSLLLQLQSLVVMGFQGVIGFCLYFDDPLAEAQAEIAFDQQDLLVRAHLFAVDFGHGDELLADLAGIDAFA